MNPQIPKKEMDFLINKYSYQPNEMQLLQMILIELKKIKELLASENRT
jgi:hypothetical protein